ncbi:MAG: glycosyltransferase [Sporocytophaga sp.]|nr:glycosyltransferase [Sporocytophaga sp.]
MSNNKLLMVIPYLGFGGAQKVFYNLSKELSQNFEVIECGFNDEDGYAYPSGNKLVYLNVHGSTNILGKFLNFIKRCTRLRKLKDQLNPYVTISHLEGADYINLLSGGPGKKILCIHGTKNYDEKIKGLIGFFRKKIFIPLLYRRADKLVTVSREIKAELIKDYGIPERKIEVIYNWFNQSSIIELSMEPIEAEYADLFIGKTIILSGRFDIQKNFLTFLKVIKEVVEVEKCKFIFLGDGTERQLMLETAKTLGLKYYSHWLSNSIIHDAELVFLGYKSNPYKFLKSADLFVLPSSWEGFPLALGEAMCCGVPVLSSNCPTGPAEMLNLKEIKMEESRSVYTDYGILLPMLKDDVSSINLWSNEIIKILNDKGLLSKYALSVKSRMALYEKDNILQQWKNLISQL